MIRSRTKFLSEPFLGGCRAHWLTDHAQGNETQLTSFVEVKCVRHIEWALA